MKWCIDGVTGSVRPCTDPRSNAKKAKADVAGSVVLEAMVSRRKKKEKTFEYEVKWQLKLIETNVGHPVQEVARWQVVFAILGTSAVLNNWRTWKRRRRRTCSRSFSLSRLPLAQPTSDFVDLVL